MQVLHHCANPCNTLIITRNEERSAVRVRSSALYISLDKRKTRDKGQLWRQCSPSRRSQRPWFVSCQLLSSIAISSSVSSNVAAATFSSRCATDEVPGMGSIADECPRSQASATCDGVAS
jgi:hypothetical protein